MDITVISFGYGHAPAPNADITVDARRQLRNPHHDPAMRELTGLDEPAREHVLATPGAGGLVTFTVASGFYLAQATSQPVTVAVGCTGGRHRSVALAEAIARGLRVRGVTVRVIHRDVDAPLLASAAHAGEGSA